MVIDGIETEFSKLWEVDFYNDLAKERFEVYYRSMKILWRKKYFDATALKKNRRFVLTRTYLNHSRLWYFGKKNFIKSKYK